ncbi:MAG: 1-deoxy-D-xylulose 5-phosphate reductoisomerase [Legionellaceae bacterium]
MMKKITLLGSTGSIGVNALDVIRQHPDKFSVFALTAHTQFEKLLAQCIEFKPNYAVLTHEESGFALRQHLKNAGCQTEVLIGESGLIHVAECSETDYVIAAIVGAKGLLPTLAAAKAGKTILLANKETLVMAGALFKTILEKSGAVFLPIDSEHNAIFQCLPSTKKDNPDIVKVLITASGGPFRTLPLDKMLTITPEQACAHPVWKMGRKISIDSATMMNKGLEIIEAYWLFDLPIEKIDVILHPQSIIHSLVEYCDGSLLAQLGAPDMRIPIAYALSWPQRMNSGAETLDLLKISQLHFEALDPLRFPCLNLAYEALKAGGVLPTVLNAANEIAVDAFLTGEIRFTDIARINAHILEQTQFSSYSDLETVLHYDNEARHKALEFIKSF